MSLIAHAVFIKRTYLPFVCIAVMKGDREVGSSVEEPFRTVVEKIELYEIYDVFKQDTQPGNMSSTPESASKFIPLLLPTLMR